MSDEPVIHCVMQALLYGEWRTVATGDEQGRVTVPELPPMTECRIVVTEE